MIIKTYSVHIVEDKEITCFVFKTLEIVVLRNFFFYICIIVTKYFKSKFKSYRYVKFKNVLHKAFYTLTILNCSEIK